MNPLLRAISANLRFGSPESPQSGRNHVAHGASRGKSNIASDPLTPAGAISAAPLLRLLFAQSALEYDREAAAFDLAEFRSGSRRDRTPKILSKEQAASAAQPAH